MGKKQTQINSKDSAETLAKHIAYLRLESIAEYQQWCVKHGFDRSLTKRNKMFASERSYAAGLASKALAKRTRLGRRATKDILLAIVNRELSARDSTKPQHKRFGQLLRLFRRSAQVTGFRDAHLTQLLEHLISVRSKIVKDTEDASRLDGISGAYVIEVLVLIASYQEYWIRPIEQWKPRTRNARRQLRSLLRHLFDRYGEVPEFMDLAWSVAMRGDGKLNPKGERLREWYLHLGLGKNLCEMELPIHYTKKMAHFFVKAPKELTIAQALRWGQVMGMKGSEQLAIAIAGSRLAEDLDNDAFWITVIRWFVDQPMLDPVQVGPMIDYIRHQRFICVQRVGAQGQINAPLEPNFTMKGRTVATLMRQVEKWHRHLATTNRVQVKAWQPCGVSEFEFIEGSDKSENQKVWTIRELLSAGSLAVEGRQLRHCVASYASSCARGHTSIWTLEVATKQGLSKLITLEVRPSTQTIVQARGKANRLMTEKERSIVRRWTTAAGLSIASHI